MVAETVSRFGKLDILVNSAATLINTPLIQDTDEADWDRMMEVNLRGPSCAASTLHRRLSKPAAGRSSIWRRCQLFADRHRPFPMRLPRPG